MTNIQQIMQMGQQLQARISRLQESLEKEELSATAGGGMVTVTVDGKGTIRSLRIDPGAVDPNDVEMLEDLVMAALSEAQKKARSYVEEEMQKATGGLPLGGMSLPGLGLL